MKKIAGDIIHHFTHVYQKPQSYGVRFLGYGVQQTEFFVILGHFLPFYHPNDPENQNFVKKKKMSGNILLLHMCTTNEDHTIFGS